MNNTDYYKILEIDRSASSHDIKNAYRELAFKHHPDRNAHNSKIAEEKFKIIVQAYEVLNDPQKRKEYDSFNENTSDSDNRSTYYQPKKNPDIEPIIGLLIGVLVFFFIEIIFYIIGYASFLLVYLFKLLILPQLLIYSNIVIAGTALMAIIAYKKRFFTLFIEKLKKIIIKFLIFLIIIFSFNGYYSKPRVHPFLHHNNSLKKSSTKPSAIGKSIPIKTLPVLTRK